MISVLVFSCFLVWFVFGGVLVLVLVSLLSDRFWFSVVFGFGSRSGFVCALVLLLFHYRMVLTFPPLVSCHG